MNQLWTTEMMSESHHLAPLEISYYDDDHYFSYHELFTPQIPFSDATMVVAGVVDVGPGVLPPSPSAISESPRAKRSYVPACDHGDGYKWRKYGQKPIKGKKPTKDSDHSRSYFRCTHPDCPVKKYVQVSKAGHATQIIYKLKHNHDPPQLRIRTTNGSVQLTNLVDAYTTFETDEQEEAMSSAQGSGDEATMTESKIIVQTKSGADHPDDGYKWRKYGQKVVNGNRNPRSYYKCTSEGCSVRKQVERCSMEPEYVSSTYDGKHNHSVPPGRK